MEYIMSTVSAPTNSSTFSAGVASADLDMILNQTSTEVWEHLRGKRIFITGGTGFMGCWLLEGFLWANQVAALNLTVHVLSRNPDAFRMKAPHLASHPDVTLIKGNVTDLQFIQQEFDIVLHAATDVATPDTDAITNFDHIVLGAKETLALATRCKAAIYLLVSSGAVYGQQPASLSHIPENYQGAPDTLDSKSAYGQAKRVAEWMTNCHAAGHPSLQVKIARCFALLGPYLPLNAHFAAGNFIRDALHKQTIQVKGDGTPYRSYLYAADMVVWLLTIMVQGKDGQAYNLGSEQAVSIAGLADAISRLITENMSVDLEKTAPAGAVAQRYIPST